MTTENNAKEEQQRTSKLPLIGGIVLGIMAFYFSFKNISLSDLWEVLKQANLPLTTLAFLVVLFNVAILALRWMKILLITPGRQNYFDLLNGIYLGQMLNIVLPARLGDVARVIYSGDKLNISKSRILGTLVVEKVTDMVVFGLSIILLLLGASLPEWVAKPGVILVWVSLIALVGIFVLTFRGTAILNIFEKWSSSQPGKWQKKIFNTLHLGLTGLESLKDWRVQTTIWLLSFATIFLSALTNHLLLLALNINAPLIAALFVLVVIQIGSSPPSTPGKLGVFHYLVILSLSAFGIAQEPALAYSLILYSIALVPKVIYGAIVLIKSPLNTQSLRSIKLSD
ncbi:MAG: flippase-like domain-containing protein [Chloroflexota bacterium]